MRQDIEAKRIGKERMNLLIGSNLLFDLARETEHMRMELINLVLDSLSDGWDVAYWK